MASDANGWPDASKPGVPMNPEKPGPHWLYDPDNESPFVAHWIAEDQMFYGGSWDGCTYLGPCLTPAEVTARERAAAAAVWLAAREACERAITPESVGHTDVTGMALLNAAVRLRNLPPPADAAAALAELVRRAVEEEREAIAAWHDDQARVLRQPMMHTLPAMPGAIICKDRARVHEDSAAAIRARGEGGE